MSDQSLSDQSIAPDDEQPPLSGNQLEAVVGGVALGTFTAFCQDCSWSGLDYSAGMAHSNTTGHTFRIVGS